MTSLDDLWAAVVRHRNDDAPKMMLADELMGSDDPNDRNRGLYIKHALDLAAAPTCTWKCQVGSRLCAICAEKSRIRMRCSMLINSTWFNPTLDRCRATHRDVRGLGWEHLDLVKGFISAGRMTSRWWSHVGPILYAETPINTVRLWDAPVVYVNVGGRDRSVHLQAMARFRISEFRGSWSRASAWERAAWLLSRYYPDVTFTRIGPGGDYDNEPDPDNE